MSAAEGPRPAPLRSPAAGEHVGPYVLTREIGAGATARVFEAAHREIDKRVAIKILLPRGEVSIARSIREGKAAARVRHPHVVDVVDVGTCDLGLYLVMELLDGGTLASRVPKPGDADVETALTWLLPVIAAVAAAHAAGVVHRDLKPSNILAAFDRHGGIVPKVGDFGISKLVGEHTDLTGADGLLGTPAYMAPEQMLDPRNAGPAADQYSLGVLLHLFVSGHLPYEADTTLALMNRVVEGRLTPLESRAPGVPAALGLVIGRALAVDPAARWPGVRELGVALLPFASDRARAAFEAELAGLTGPPSFHPPRGATPNDTTFEDEPASPLRAVSVTQDTTRRTVGLTKSGGRVRTIVAAAVLAAPLVALGAWALGPWRAKDELGLGAFGANATPPREVVDGAAQEYRLGMKAIRDSAWEVALSHFRRATQIDPEFGAAHLRVAMTVASPEIESRAALARARVLRDQLSERDRVFLDAYERLYFESPADHEGHRAILRAGLVEFPNDAELTMHLAIANQSPDRWAEAEALASRALELEADYPDALQTIGRARAARGDVEGAFEVLARCVQSSPLAIGCRRAEANLLSQEQRCEDLGAALNRWTTLDPLAFEPQQMLAGLYARRGMPWQAIEDVQRQRWLQSSAENRPSRELKDRVRTALYRDEVAVAATLLEELVALLGDSRDREADDWIVAHQLFALDAAGEDARAAEVARDLLARRAASPALAQVEDNAAVSAIGYLAQAGAIDSRRRDELGALAVRWPEDATARAKLEAQLALALVSTGDEARVALARIETADAAIPAALSVAHARALAHAGKPADALRALDVAARGCDGLALPALEARRLARVGFD